MSVQNASKPYVLGTGDDELARLGLQHRLWADAAHAAWKEAGIGMGSRVLDVGCGPGYASFDLAQLVTPSGSVLGIDESAGFVEHLTAQAEVRGLEHLAGMVHDVQKLRGAAIGPFDAAYARWVLCFTPDPEAVVAGVAAALRHGGAFVVHDYFAYTGMTAGPRLASHDRLVAATAQSFKSRGGDPDVVGRVPGMLERCGMETVSIRVHQRVARGGKRADGSTDPMLAWPMTWWRTYAPKLVAMGLLSQAHCDEALADLAMIEGDATRFIVCPPVYEVIARKR